MWPRPVLRAQGCSRGVGRAHVSPGCLAASPGFSAELIFLIIYLWLCRVFVAVRGLSLVAASGGYSSLRCMGSRHTGSVVVARRLSSCGARA